MSLLIWLVYAVLLLCTSAVSIAAVIQRRAPAAPAPAVGGPGAKTEPPLAELPHTDEPPQEATPDPAAEQKPDATVVPGPESGSRERFVSDWV